MGWVGGGGGLLLDGSAEWPPGTCGSFSPKNKSETTHNNTLSLNKGVPYRNSASVRVLL